MIRLFSLLVLCLLSIPANSLAAGNVHLYTEKQNVAPGETFAIDVLAEKMPPVYGMEMVLEYSPDTLELIDTDSEIDGIQIGVGDFFHVDGPMYPLQNDGIDSTGQIFYAASLLNPAPEAAGSGTLARLEMIARKPGPATIKVKNILFGTRDGRGIRPTGDMALSLVSKKPVNFLVLWGFTSLVLATAAFLWKFLRRRKRPASAR
jgi:hypothetical protein